MLLSRFCGWADCDVLAQMMLYYEWTCTRPRQLFSVGHNCKGNARVCRCVCVCVCVYVCVRTRTRVNVHTYICVWMWR